MSQHQHQHQHQGQDQQDDEPLSPIVRPWLRTTSSWETPPRSPSHSRSVPRAPHTVATGEAIYTVPTTDTFGDEDTWGPMTVEVTAGRSSWDASNSTTSNAQGQPLAQTSATSRLLTPSQRAKQQTLLHLTGTNAPERNSSHPPPKTSHFPTDAQRQSSAHTSTPSTVFRSKPNSKDKQPHTQQTLHLVGGSGVPLARIAERIPLSRRPHRITAADLQALASHPKDFSLPIDAPAVTVQFVPTAQRSAYARLAAPTMARYRHVLKQASRFYNNQGGNLLSTYTSTRMAKRLSPALQHLQVLHELQAQDWVRQVEFAPTLGIHAEAYEHGPLHAQRGHNANEPVHDKRDGRWHPLHLPSACTALPSPPPQLSHRKTRLPNRADVGWPGATTPEIELKQREIQHETAWEEATPRLVVLCTAADLGHVVAAEEPVVSDVSSHPVVNVSDEGETIEVVTTTPATTSVAPATHTTRDSPATLKHANISIRPPRGLPGMPWAGQPLQQMYAHNATAWQQTNPSNGAEEGAAAADSSWQPNPYSLLAPPLQATRSRHGSWRPRQIHDRAPLRQYAVVCPTQLHMPQSTDDAVALDQYALQVALYLLPTDPSTTTLRGKISENAWFPVKTPNLCKKAIFSLPPSSFLFPNHEQISATDLYFVVKIHRQIQNDAPDWRIPVALGISPLSVCPKWPKGRNGQLDLYAWSTLYDASPDDWLNRLTELAREQQAHSTEARSVERSDSSPEPPISVDNSESLDSMTTPAKRSSSNRVGRLFRTPRTTKSNNSTSVVTPAVVAAANAVEETVTSWSRPFTRLESWRLELFVSFLGTDFLSALLHKPILLEPPTDAALSIPRILVDPTGEAAVSLPPAPMRAADLPPHEYKRSDLVRLPPTDTGYVQAAEFFEILPLAPRRDKQYPIDAPFGTAVRSLLNLLYIYPRFLKVASAGSGATVGANSFPSTLSFNWPKLTAIRIRLLQNQVSVDDVTGEIRTQQVALPYLYSPVPWKCEAMVEEVLTSVHQSNDRPSADAVSRQNLAFGDEIKLRLPDILDGSVTLEFAIMTGDGEASMKSLGATTVPLSSSSREPSTGVKVTTVIPNGIHRIKIASFQLQVETRLVSSLHVTDPSVALALRDFPYSTFQDAVDHGLTNASNVGPSGTVPAVNSFDSSVDMSDSFQHLLSASSPSAAVAHFRPLLHMHLCNFINLNENARNDPSVAAQFMTANTTSLFELLRCVKNLFINESDRTVDQASLSAWLKEIIDVFDEGYLSNTTVSVSDGRSFDRSDQLPSDEDAPLIESSDSTDSAASVDSLGEDSVRMPSKRKVYQRYRARVERIMKAIGTSEKPFYRVAYGASTADRMRVAAELEEEEVDHQWFDDDETIMTELTSPRDTEYEGAAYMEMARRHLHSNAAIEQTIKEEVSRNSILQSDSLTRKDGSGGNHVPGAGNDFARRFRSAAQTVLAPCVGPSLSSILSLARGVSLPTQTMSDAGESDVIDTVSLKKSTDKENGFEILYGSDEEDNGVIGRHIRPHFRDDEGEKVYRGFREGPMFMLSSKALGDHEVLFVGGHFLYESIIVLWLRTWSEYQSSFSQKRQKSLSVPVPLMDPSKAMEKQFISFFNHMDLLLPLCLKSIAHRYTAEVSPIYPFTARVQLDAGHQILFEQLAEMLARGLMGMSLAGLGSPESRQKALERSLASADAVVEFFMGILPIFHAEHARSIITKYFKTLKDAETEHLLGGSGDIHHFEWNEETLLRVRCSRQLRLHAIELLSSMPAFLHLNYPVKIRDEPFPSSASPPTWLNQHSPTKQKGIALESNRSVKYPDGYMRVPVAGWLSTLVLDDALSICSLSSESVIAEALAHAELAQSTKQTSGVASSLKRRPGASLQRDDLLMFQSIAIHAINIVYELIVRRHVLDRRYQSESARRRIATLFAMPILEKSVSSVRWLARMESTHKVRALWLLCFVFVLQEAPDSLVQDFIRGCCDPNNIRVHRFIRLLRICSSTFHGFLEHQGTDPAATDAESGLSPWLLQESFNTVCATTNTVVESCVDFKARFPQEGRKVMQGLIDLLLHILTTPQSSVTHLRALGGALQAMEQFGVEMFLEVTGDNFQHWGRVLLSLMNSQSLSVRSIAVDFAVSLFCGTFDSAGTIDEVSLVLATVLPEVVAREIGLYHVSGQVHSLDDASRCVWPLRRALYDLQDANPLDDDRVNPQLPPLLRTFGRAAQAIIDGVLVELRLKKVPFLKLSLPKTADALDAEEESLYEAASFFCAETSPLQRIRWLLSLKLLHEEQSRWIEAGEAAMLCAQTVTISIQYLKIIWRPTNFALWTDNTRSKWLDSVGEARGQPDFGNRKVMDFANSFLEPEGLFPSTSNKSSAAGRLLQPTIAGMCELLNTLAKQSTDLYLKEYGCEELALKQLEGLQKHLEHGFGEIQKQGSSRGFRGLRRQVEEETLLRRMMSNIAVALSKLSDLILARATNPETRNLLAEPPRVYVAVCISGRKVKRFEESTFLPPFLEWNEYCICAIPVGNGHDNSPLPEEPEERKALYADRLGRLLLASLKSGPDRPIIEFLNAPRTRSSRAESDGTFLEVFPVEPSASLSSLKALTLTCRRFKYRRLEGDSQTALDFSVALPFPCALSSQRSVVTSLLER